MYNNTLVLLLADKNLPKTNNFENRNNKHRSQSCPAISGQNNPRQTQQRLRSNGLGRLWEASFKQRK